jgi:FkbM family methyltransferase
MKNLLSRFVRPGEPDEVEHRVGDYVIRLPVNNLIPKFQAANRLYDRFPLALGQEQYDGWLVDIGANVGTTLAALASCNSKRIICIEPNAEWFGKLEATAQAARESGSTVICVQAAVGPDGARADIKPTSSSTAYYSPSDAGDTVLKSLDDIIRPIVSESALALVKCDVDGFDAAVLDSGRTMITEHLPLLYAEAEIRTSLQLEAWARTIRWLDLAGYRFAALDNFGLPLLRNANAESIMDCLHYTLNLNAGASTRTSYYFDLFAAAPRRRQQFDEVLRRYDAEFVRAPRASTPQAC